MDAFASSSARRWAIGALGGVATLLIVVGSFGTGSSGREAIMAAVAPGVVAEADIPEGLIPLYHGARDRAAVFAATPCYCGCMEMLGHRHLLDCFRRPDGSGWESHALGCGVCLGEAQHVLELVAGGFDADAVVAAVIDRWSDPYLSEE